MRKLIEDNFPFAKLSAVAEAESWRKEVYRPVYYLHKWWARRLGSVFRGILLGACLEEGDNFWDRFYGKNNFSGTLVFDPFMGSGVTVGEAIKLGLTAVGQDINQVAYFACRAAFAKYGPADVVTTYEKLARTVGTKLLSYFETVLETGEKATVLYYFLVKVVSCPVCGRDIELFSSRIFSKNAVPQKDPAARSVCPRCRSINCTRYDAVSVTCSVCSHVYNPQSGTISGSKVECDSCGHCFRLVDRMSSLSGPLPFRRYAKMVLTADGQKKYASMNSFDAELENSISQEISRIRCLFPDVEINPGNNTDQILRHNYRFWHELFSDRQLLCIHYLIDAIRHIGDPDQKLLFTCLFSGVLEFNNLFASFKGEGTGAVRHMFAHHVLKPEVMPIEANMWGTTKSSGSFSTLFRSRVLNALAYKNDPTELKLAYGKTVKVGGINRSIAVDVSEDLSLSCADGVTAFLGRGDSSNTSIPTRAVDVVVTDPPFFDNVHYSELADFFFYWISQVFDYFETTTTRQNAEVQDVDPSSFSRKLAGVFCECERVLKDEGLLVFTYHHSRCEGWMSVHRAIRQAGLVCTHAYPIKAEMSVSMPLKQAKSPIHLDLILVCKKAFVVNGGRVLCADVKSAVRKTEEKVGAMRSAGISVSLGDAKVILMGQLLCEAHCLQDIEEEEKFLFGIDDIVDAYVGGVVKERGEILYDEEQPRQLMLFEEMEEYLASRVSSLGEKASPSS